MSDTYQSVVALPVHDPNRDGPFNEDRLLEAVEAVWGRHGAHADVLRLLIAKARGSDG